MMLMLLSLLLLLLVVMMEIQSKFKGFHIQCLENSFLFSILVFCTLWKNDYSEKRLNYYHRHHHNNNNHYFCWLGRNFFPFFYISKFGYEYKASLFIFVGPFSMYLWMNEWMKNILPLYSLFSFDLNSHSSLLFGFFFC